MAEEIMSPEQLQAAYNDQQKTIADLQKAVADMQRGADKKTDAKVIGSLQKENAEMRKQLATVTEQLSIIMKSGSTPTPKPTIPKDSFKVGDAKYKFTRAEATIPGLGKRTALEILNDDEKYDKLGGVTIKEYLVSNGGSAMVAEVVEE